MIITKEQRVISDEETSQQRYILLNEIKEAQKTIGELGAEILENNKIKSNIELQLGQHIKNSKYY